jgi:MioC protein
MSSGKLNIGIFVATMTGLADVCGEEIEAALMAAGLPSDRQLMDSLDAGAFAPYDLLVIVSSTYGHGEIPDNGQMLFEALSGADLSGKRFAIFGLGDRTYADTFCAAGDSWDRLLATSGAQQLVELMRHDASSGTLAEDVAGVWAAETLVCQIMGIVAGAT